MQLRQGLFNFGNIKAFFRNKTACHAHNDLVDGLSRSNYPGLRKLFKLLIPPFKEWIVHENTYELDPNVRKQPHIVIVITERSGNTNVPQYKPFKQRLTKIGVPCQFVLAENIAEHVPNVKYAGYLRNLALNIYAKIGGIPWILGRPISVPDRCFIGLAAISRRGKTYFSTQIFNSEGLWIRGHMECVERDKYADRLSAALADAIDLYTERLQPPSEIIIHKEGEIWERKELALLTGLNSDVKVVSVKKTGLPRMYDVGIPSSFMVSRGTYVQIDFNEAVIATSGAPHMIQGTQKPLTVEIRSKRVNSSLVKETCREIFLLSLVFSGYTFAVTSDPVTTRFASSAVNLSATHNIEVENPSLQRKAWFL